MRPPSVPEQARWSPEDAEWGLGQTRDDYHVGAWTWWRADGTLLGESSFDDAGQLQGRCRRFHPSGNLAYEATFERGRRHGREIICRPVAGETPEVGAQQLEEMDPDLHRMDLWWSAGELRATTLYNRAGLLAPIAVGADGRVRDLAAHLDKLMPGTSLALTTPFLRTMGSAPKPVMDAILTGGSPLPRAQPMILPPKIPGSMVTAARYICLAVVGGTLHRVEITDPLGQPHLAIIEAAEIAKSFTLSVDRLAHEHASERTQP